MEHNDASQQVRMVFVCCCAFFLAQQLFRAFCPNLQLLTELCATFLHYQSTYRGSAPWRHLPKKFVTRFGGNAQRSNPNLSARKHLGYCLLSINVCLFMNPKSLSKSLHCLLVFGQCGRSLKKNFYHLAHTILKTLVASFSR
jgi:hypothetical protein